MDTTPPLDTQLFPVLLKALSSHFGDLRVLFWRLDVHRNELTFLNDGTWPGLGERVPLVLRNPAYARDALVPEDRERFFSCIERIRGQQPASTVVRIRDSDGSVGWITLMGIPDPTLTSYCIGLVADCSGLADLVLGTRSDVGVEQKIALFDNPVLLFRFGDKRVARANAAARAFLGPRLADPEAISLDDLLASSPIVQASRVFEALLFDGQWSGSLVVADQHGRLLTCTAKVRALSQADEHLLWMSLHPDLAALEELSAVDDAPDVELAPATRSAFARADSIEAMLRAFLLHQPKAVHAEAVMRSRIFGSENRVVVTGIAEHAAAMPSKETFPYEGTIAENIVRFGLDHLIVEDTSRSTKPIDWVLFIPKGIKSYYAKPFFESGVLKNVFIVCSTEAGRFTEHNVRAYLPFFDSIQATLDRLEETRDQRGF